MIVNSDQFIPSSFTIISYRTFLLYYSESILLKKSNKFTELHIIYFTITTKLTGNFGAQRKNCPGVAPC